MQAARLRRSIRKFVRRRLCGDSEPIKHEAKALSAAMHRGAGTSAVVPIVEARNCTGLVEHYYHFLLGYFLPIAGLSRLGLLPHHVCVRSCGPMDRHFDALADHEFDVLDEREIDLRLHVSTPVIGMTGFDLPESYVYKASWIRECSDEVMRRLLLDRISSKQGILLIERKHDPFYVSSGSQRRSVPNCAEIAASLGSLCEVNLVSLENTSLVDQIKLFREHDVIIAQHGAALTNIVWARQDALVVEIMPPMAGRPHDHYSGLAEALGLRYRAVHQEHRHAPVAPSALLEVVRDFVSSGDAPELKNGGHDEFSPAYPAR